MVIPLRDLILIRCERCGHNKSFLQEDSNKNELPTKIIRLKVERQKMAQVARCVPSVWWSVGYFPQVSPAIEEGASEVKRSIQ